ncbi:MAG: four helix bundle protein [Deltaproteobacteria bacterium]|nr:four helix bundle protein [Deltaproteobacteria bacterium]
MNDFEHERLDVYRAAIDFLVVADEIAVSLPRGRAYLVDQLRRAATSIALNIAEGAGEFSPGDKARFYRMARRSATECAAILDASRAVKLTDTQLSSKGRALLLRVVAMLTAMVLRLKAPESGSGSGSGSGSA